jgi:hypothetical protein
MSRESEFRPKYGVIGAGATGKSLIGRLPGKAREVGPVAAVSFRVASRIANALRAGYPVRTAEALSRPSVVLFHSPPGQASGLLALLESAPIPWQGRALIFCDCEAPPAARARLHDRGVSTAVLRQFGLAGRIAVEGEGAALKAGRRIVRELRLKPVEISAGAADRFDAAVTLGTCALAPLIDRAAAMLREAGVRDSEAARLASALFQQTAREYARSGRQSWGWYLRKPVADRLEAQIEAAGPRMGPLLRELLLLGFDTFDRHAEVAGQLRRGVITPSE